MGDSRVSVLSSGTRGENRRTSCEIRGDRQEDGVEIRREIPGHFPEVGVMNFLGVGPDIFPIFLAVGE